MFSKLKNIFFNKGYVKGLFMIAAHTTPIEGRGVMGLNNDLPWHEKDDLMWFKHKTHSTALIMGRKTYESVKDKFKPTITRPWYVLTKSKEKGQEILVDQLNNVYVYNDFNECVEDAIKDKGIAFIIGGGELFRKAHSVCEKLLITEIKDYGEIYNRQKDNPDNEWVFYPYESLDKSLFELDYEREVRGSEYNLIFREYIRK